MRPHYDAFMKTWRPEDAGLRNQILAARAALAAGRRRPDTALHDCAALCIALGSDGLRGELTLLRAARALAAFEGDRTLTRSHLRRVAPMALSHRLRRDPLDEAGSGARVARDAGGGLALTDQSPIAPPAAVTRTDSRWDRVELALMALAVDPAGLKGLWLRARSGPVRDRVIAGAGRPAAARCASCTLPGGRGAVMAALT